MAILLDDEVYSSPAIRSAISDRGQITGSFSESEQRELVRTLDAGTLPARVKFLSQNTFGPSIGRNNRNLAIRAAYIGLIAVAGFMLVYYLLAGFVANVALMLNILLVLGVMSLLDAVFTLPGIAGVILTIGIAVDANVLIFERLRREQVGRESIRLAVADTYKSTWPVIRDANITTLITCLILGWVGTEELRGFAITLGLGVVFSMFCALFVTRWILELLSENRRNRPFALPRLIREPKWRWVSKRYYFWGISIVLIGIGVGSLIWQGGDIWGIEFSAGTKAILQFKDDALIRNPRTGNMELTNDGLVREQFAARATQGGYEKLRATARVEERINPAKTDHFLRDYDLDGDEKVALAEFQRAKKNADFLKLVDGRGDGDGFLTRDEIREFIPATAYQISTTETDVGLIRAVATQAFGAALTRRTSCAYETVEGATLRELSADILPGSEGLTKISETPTPGSISPKDAYPQYQDVLLDYAGGVVFVVRNVNPAISTAELKQRIREMRSQPDFAGQSSETEVLPFQSAGEDRFASFAVLVAPPNVLVTEDEDTWKEFAKTQKELLGAALSREEAMVASNFDAVIAGETAQRAVVAILLSWGGIVLYLALSFRGFQWGFAAVVCLVHDVVIVVGLIAASGWLHQTFIGRALGIDSFKIDLAMVAAMLTVIGYSVNDTIVVFGHVRERPAIGRGRGWSTRTVDWSVVSRALDDAINRTFSRTMVTSLTTGMVVFIMYVWGGPGIHAFNFVLLAGVIFGTYSSIAVAAPLLLGLRGALAARIRREPGAKET
jgi:SecD/SecF fusion protein